jgi:YegS/Rv2252/BmrU family lipid kinase
VVPAAEGTATTPSLDTSVAVIINPISGAAGRPDVARARAAQAASTIASHGGDAANVFITERGGHARDLARAAVARGVSTIVSWGGDGTMNEIGSALAFTEASLVIVPSGSGNGLARELGIPFAAAAALDVAWSGHSRTIDAGEIDDRLFFNVAGIGLDARVAHRFAVDGLERRGFSRYLEITTREMFGFIPDELTITTPGSSTIAKTLLVAIANGRQYGNGAIVAPNARLDDGLLDIVVVRNRAAVRACLELPLVFLGKIDRLGGVTVESTGEVTITAPYPLVYHLDGEPIAGTLSLHARARTHALKIKVPR